jgi:hypothetical protein
MVQKKRVYKMRLSKWDQEALSEIRELMGFPAYTSLIIKLALRFFRRYLKAEAEFEERYLRRLAEEVVKKRAYPTHDVKPYIDEARKKVNGKRGQGGRPTCDPSPGSFHL